jgi:hypothetical protein
MEDYFEDLGDLEGWDEFDGFDAFVDETYDLGEEDEFLRQAWTWLTQPIPTQSGRGTTTRARRFALGGARAALPVVGGLAGTALGGRLAGGAGAGIGRTIGTGLGGALASLIPQEMDYFAQIAAETEDEGEAEAFIGALIPMAARLLPQVGGAIMRVAPALIRGAAGTVRTLHGHPAARQLLRGMGTVIRQTGADIARQVAQGRPVTGQTALRSLAHHTYGVLQNPRRIQRTAARARRRSPAGVRCRLAA